MSSSGLHGKTHGKTERKTGRPAAGSARAAGHAPPRRAARAQGTEATSAKATRAETGDAAPAVAAPRLGWREAIIATVAGLGYELVEIERGQRGLLTVFIDRLPGRVYTVPSEFVTVDDCEQVTRQLQYALEVEGLDYARLEVSSPGLDRPLKTPADFQRFAGLAVHVTLKLPFQGRKVWQGVLGAADEPGGYSLVFLQGKTEQVFGFKFEEVREARLVPVVDFKGRKSMGAARGAAPAGEAAVLAPTPGSAGG